MDTLKNKLSILDNYTFFEKIGEGTCGYVFKAEQRNTRKKVAIKTIKFIETNSEQDRQEQIIRFEKEIQLCARINHPNIIELVDNGYSAIGEPYAVFEYIEGITLKEFLLLKKGLSGNEMAQIMQQVLDGLVAIHAKGIVHRDLKPENIMVSEHGTNYTVKIIDFGIAANISDFYVKEFQNLSSTQNQLGSPKYSSPEQLMGDIQSTNSDLYAWGLIVIECLTGQAVVNGATIAEVFQRQLMPSPVPIPLVIIDHDLTCLLRRVLKKKPTNRVKETQAVLKEFDSINFSNLSGNIILDKIADTCFEETIIGKNVIPISVLKMTMMHAV